VQEALNDLEESGILNPDQGALLRRIYGRELFSVYWELRLLLYAGILTLTTGLGLLIAKYFASIGHLALLSAIALGCAGCFAYCLRRGGGFSPDKLPAPDAAYDYVLLLGCLLLGTFQGYLELRYQLLAQYWNLWLLGGGLWDSALRENALVFGALLVAAGAIQTRRGWKRHFLPVHLHLGVNVLLAALVSGVGSRGIGPAYLTGLLLAGFGSAFYAQRARSFAFLLYALLYGYLGVTIFVFDNSRWDVEGFIFYFLVTSAALVTSLVAFHRRFRSAE